MDEVPEQEPLKKPSAATCQLLVERPVYDHSTLLEAYHQDQPKTPFSVKVKKCIKETCSPESLQHRLLLTVPFVTTLRMYKLREYILSDIIAGLTVAILNIPQGMGFALLTSVPPIYGIYSSFFPVLLYFFFGTAPHVSMGTMAVISIMVGVAVEREASLSGFSEAPLSEINSITNYSSNFNYQNYTSFDLMMTITSPTESDVGMETAGKDLVSFKIAIAALVTFLAGIIQICMSFLHLGVVTTFMSTSFIGGFTTGAAFHITTSQIKFFLGIPVQRYGGIFKLPKTWINIFSNIKLTNIAELIIAVICFTFLIIIKEIINVRYKSKIKFPIPAELIIVVLGTVISYFAKLATNFDVRVIGHIARGVPPPEVPPLEHSPAVFVDALLVAIVGFVISFSMADIFSRKHRYEVDTNQELLANGMCNWVSSFFHCFAGCAAPPRCAILDSTGGKTTVSNIFTALLLLLVMLAIGPWFQSLPNCVLAAIIVVALFPMFKQFKDLLPYWKINRYDVSIWLFTFLCTVILDIDLGLGLGIGFSILTIILQAFFSNGFQLATAKETDLYLPMQHYSVHDVPNTRVFRFEGSLYFVSRETFKRQLFEATINPRHIKKDKKGLKKDIQLKTIVPDTVTLSVDNNTENNNHNDRNGADLSNGAGQCFSREVGPDKANFENIILDCSAMSYIDVMGINTIKQLHSDFKSVGITLALAYCNQSMLGRLEAAEILGSDINVYPTIHDAVLAKTYCVQRHLPLGNSKQDLTIESST